MTTKSSRKLVWTGRIVSGLVILFLLLDAAGKFARPAAVVEGTAELGYQPGVIIPLGVILLTCTILYTLPWTMILGAILLTGYLGGAVATHVRVDNPMFTHTLFPVYVGILLWLGLYLREPGLRLLAPLRTSRSISPNSAG